MRQNSLSSQLTYNMLALMLSEIGSGLHHIYWNDQHSARYRNQTPQRVELLWTEARMPAGPVPDTLKTEKQ
jgi:hypothetical protein